MTPEQTPKPGPAITEVTEMRREASIDSTRAGAANQRTSCLPASRLWMVVGVPWLIVAGCSGRPSRSGAKVLTDLFDAGTPFTISDTVLKSLTARVTEEDAARLGPRVGHVPLEALGASVGESHPGMTSGFALTTVSGERLANAISPVPRVVLETPYWTSIFRRLGARGASTVFVATNLLYKIYEYGGQGQRVDSIWVPPPSWRQARQPSRAEFLPDRPAVWSGYLDSITVLKALAVVADSILVVSVGGYWEEGDSRADNAHQLVEVYVGRDNAGVDLGAPGELVAYSRSSLFFLKRSPDPDRSTVTEYIWRGSRR